MEFATELAKKNILIVEDQLSMRHTIKASLRNQGFDELIEAGDAEKALALMGKKKVDLIISDWMMPGMSGLELFSAVKSDSDLEYIPFILLTGNDQKEKVTEALKAGIKHYIVKPFNPRRLFEKVAELLQQCNEEKQKAG